MKKLSRPASQTLKQSENNAVRILWGEGGRICKVCFYTSTVLRKNIPALTEGTIVPPMCDFDGSAPALK